MASQLPEPDPGTLAPWLAFLPWPQLCLATTDSLGMTRVLANTVFHCPICSALLVWMLRESTQCQRGHHPSNPAATLGSQLAFTSKENPLLLLPDSQGADLAHQKVKNFWLGSSLPPLTVLTRAPLTMMGA